MTPEEIEANIQAVIAGKNADSAPASVNVAPVADAPAVTTPSMLIPPFVGTPGDNAVAEHVRKRKEQEDSEQEKFDNRSNFEKGVDYVSDLLPKDMSQAGKKVAESAGAAATGAMVKRGLATARPDLVYGTPEYEQAQQTAAAAKNAPFTEAQRKYDDYVRGVEAAQNKAAQAQAQVVATQPDLHNYLQEMQAHDAQAQRLQADMESLRQKHDTLAQQLADAELDNKFHGERDVNQELNKLKGKSSYGINDRSFTTANEISAANAANNRSMVSGLTSLGLDPDKQISKAPGMRATESGVLVPGEVVDEQARQKQAIIDDIALKKKEAEERIKQLKEQQKNAADALKEQRATMSEHARAKPQLPAAVSDAQTAARANEVEYQRLLAGHPAPPTPTPPENGFRKYVNADTVRALGKLTSRYVPFVGAMAAPHEAERAKEEYDKGNYLRAGAYGLGSAGAIAQATGNPLAMGIGDIAQTPATILGMYDLFSHPEAPAGGLPKTK